jgi:hypothetical protein
LIGRKSEGKEGLAKQAINKIKRMTGLLLFSYIGNEWFDVRNVYPGVDI